MSDINEVILIGRVTRDFGSGQYDTVFFSSGAKVTILSIACNRSVKKQDKWVDEVHFFNVKIFGFPDSKIDKFLVKGKRVAIQGHLQQNKWEECGVKHSEIQIIADKIQLLSDANGDYTPTTNTSQQQNGQKGAEPLIDYTTGAIIKPSGATANSNDTGERTNEDAAKVNEVEDSADGFINEEDIPF